MTHAPNYNSRLQVCGIQDVLGGSSVSQQACGTATVTGGTTLLNVSLSWGTTNNNGDLLGSTFTHSGPGFTSPLAFGQLAAEYYSGTKPSAPCTTCYLSYDYLGNMRLVTDAQARIVARHDFAPFGQEIPSGAAGRTAPSGSLWQWGSTNDVDAKFTGQLRDQESGEDFFNARYFTATLGRFNSPDPANAGATLDSSQSWNGYSYVLGNPLGLADPSGAQWKTVSNQVCTAVVSSSTDYSPTTDSFQNNSGATSECHYTSYWVWVPDPVDTVGSGGGPGGGRPAKNGTRPDWLNNITSIFGYDQRIKLPSCAALAFSTAADDLNPFSPGTFGAIKHGVEGALATGQLYYFNAAMSHAAARGLTYPNKSSIFRGLLKNSSNLGKAAGDYLGPAAVDAGLLHGFILEMIAMQCGECQ